MPQVTREEFFEISEKMNNQYADIDNEPASAKKRKTIDAMDFFEYKKYELQQYENEWGKKLEEIYIPDIYAEIVGIPKVDAKEIQAVIKGFVRLLNNPEDSVNKQLIKPYSRSISKLRDKLQKSVGNETRNEDISRALAVVTSLYDIFSDLHKRYVNKKYSIEELQQQEKDEELDRMFRGDF